MQKVSESDSGGRPIGRGNAAHLEFSQEHMMALSRYTVRVATPADGAAITAVLAASYGELLAAHYDAELLERALPLMSKANPVLLTSGKYYVAATSKGEIVGCGGWSFERPGTDDVVRGLAHVRHFGTDPRWTGRGVAKAILSRCIRDAEAQGVQVMEAYSTLAAVVFYRALGFVIVSPIEVMLAPGIKLPSIHMRRGTN